MAEISRLAFSLTKLGIQALERLFKASVSIHDAENIPDGRFDESILPYFPQSAKRKGGQVQPPLRR